MLADYCLSGVSLIFEQDGDTVHCSSYGTVMLLMLDTKVAERVGERRLHEIFCIA